MVTEALNKSFKKECKFNYSDSEDMIILHKLPEKGKSKWEVKSEYLKIRYY